MIIQGADYEHTLGMGANETACGRVEYLIRPLTALYRMILGRGTFEVSEFSLSNHVMFYDRGDRWMEAIPVFPSRAFRHSALVVPKDSEITCFRDLRGKRVGVPDYSMTAAVWVRGIWAEHYGLHWSEVHWVSGATPRFPVPEGVSFSTTTAPLEQLLALGKIDALLTTKLEEDRDPLQPKRFRTLLPNVISEEQRYFDDTGIFPIMHTVVIHQNTTTQHPKVNNVIFDIYSEAKDRAMERQLGTTLLPWARLHWNDAMARFGGDPYEYGLSQRNRHNIDVLCGYLREQKLVTGVWNSDRIFDRQ